MGCLMDEKKLMADFDRLNRMMKRYFESFFSGSELTSIQALALHYVIVESENRDIFPKDLEEFLEIKGSSVNSLLNNMEKNGYLYRESLPEDGRYKRLVLTEKTRKIEVEIKSKVNSYMSSMFSGIPEKELEVFRRVILQMAANTGN